MILHKDGKAGKVNAWEIEKRTPHLEETRREIEKLRQENARLEQLKAQYTAELKHAGFFRFSKKGELNQSLEELAEKLQKNLAEQEELSEKEKQLAFEIEYIRRMDGRKERICMMLNHALCCEPKTADDIAGEWSKGYGQMGEAVPTALEISAAARYIGAHAVRVRRKVQNSKGLVVEKEFTAYRI